MLSLIKSNLLLILLCMLTVTTSAQTLTGTSATQAESLKKAIDEAKNSGNSNTESLKLIELGKLYSKNGINAQAETHLKNAVSVAEGAGLKPQVRIASLELSTLYAAEGKIDLAIASLQKAIPITRKSGSKATLAQELLTLAYLSRLSAKYTEALDAVKEAERIVVFEQYNETMVEKCYKEYASIYKAQGNSTLYLKYQKILEEKELAKTKLQYDEKTKDIEMKVIEKDKELSVKDEMIVSKDKALASFEDSLREAARIAKEKDLNLRIADADLKRQAAELETEKTLRNSLIGGLLALALFILVFFYQYRQIKKTNSLLAISFSEIQQQKEEITIQKNLLEDRNVFIERQNEQIKSSIRYAQTIQAAILPFHETIQKDWKFFVLYKPRDIVSGDFYWHAVIEDDQSGQTYHYFAVIDCTGHGVPGAFMSMIGSRLLNEVVYERGIHEPATILESMNKELQKALRQDTSDNDDGMDIILCRIHKTSSSECTVKYCGANRPLIYFDSQEKAIISLRGTLATIGGVEGRKYNEPFENKEIVLKKNDIIYLTSDGYIDQNDPERRKFGSKKFFESLEKIAPYDISLQERLLQEAMEDHKKDSPQRDDITIMGVQI